MRTLPTFICLWTTACFFTAVFSGCQQDDDELPASGSLRIVLRTDMVTPKDIDQVWLKVMQEDKPLLLEALAVGPDDHKLPASFEVQKNRNSTPVDIQAIAFKANEPRVERTARTPIPEGVGGQISLALNYLCVGHLVTDDASNEVSSDCPNGETCVNGACETTQVTPVPVPSVAPDGSAGAGAGAESTDCFPVEDCFAHAQMPGTIDEESCTATLPPGADAAELNVALQFLHSGHGVCTDTACWVVLDLETWSVDGAELTLPKTVCARAKETGAAIVITTACPAKSEALPHCGADSTGDIPIATPDPPGGVTDACSEKTETCNDCGTRRRTCADGVASWTACDEPEFERDPGHCGSCANDCTELAHVESSSVACTEGVCTYRCSAEYGDCSDDGSGCIALTTPSNCGACGVTCQGETPICAPTDSGESHACAASCEWTLCPNDACVDLETSQDNCGECGNACSGDQICSAGECACADDLQDCDGVCVDFESSETHCGACGVECSGETTCQSGSCRCPSGLAECDGLCIELTEDANCGACGNACSGGTTCLDGECACPEAEEDCYGACVDLETSGAHCGACGAECSDETTCQSGSCQCPSGRTECGGLCIDLTEDPSHCGGCGLACSTSDPNAVGVACEEGSCVTECAAGFTSCSDECVDTSVDSQNCGGCGASCGTGACRDGSCDCPRELCPTVVAEGQIHPSELVVVDGDVYWTNWGTVTSDGMYAKDGSVMRWSHADNSVTAIATEQDTPYGIATDGEHVYWVNTGRSTGTNEGNVMRVPVGSTTEEVFAAGEMAERIAVGNGMV